MPDINLILGENGVSVLGTLGRSSLAADFYLAGGTGLALQLYHRRSFDLDFFQIGQTEHIPWRKVAGEIKRLFGERLAVPVLRQSDQVVWEIAGVKVAFIGYPFVLVEPLLDAGTLFRELSGVRLATPWEIALMKAYALGRRATFRDYVDLYFTLKSGSVTVKEIVTNAAKKFVLGGETLFSPRLFLEQLTYAEDAEDQDVALNLLFNRGLTAGQVQAFLKAAVASFLAAEISRTKGPSL
ncbi:MAG: nucleotidyl transferase AbiEii/AbiGii toxin family protein [Bacillota bacterium]